MRGRRTRRTTIISVIVVLFIVLLVVPLVLLFLARSAPQPPTQSSANYTPSPFATTSGMLPSVLTATSVSRTVAAQMAASAPGVGKSTAVARALTATAAVAAAYPTETIRVEFLDGKVTVTGPSEIGLGESKDIRVEIIVLNTTRTPGALNPSPTPTPLVSENTPIPTNTPQKVVPGGESYIRVFPVMAAGLGGTDIESFDSTGTWNAGRFYEGGTLTMLSSATNYWQWSIKPKDEGSVGTRSLEVRIYLPTAGFSSPEAVIPITINVSASVSSVLNQLGALAGIAIALGGAVATLYSGYRFLRSRMGRRKAGRTASPPKN